MKGSAALAIAFLAVCFAVGVYDVYVTYLQGSDETVSTVLGRWGAQFPVLPLMIGLVLGHVFWPRIPAVPVPGMPSSLR